MVRFKLAIVLGLIGFAVLAGGAYALGSRSNDDSTPPEQGQTSAWAAEVEAAVAKALQFAGQMIEEPFRRHDLRPFRAMMARSGPSRRPPSPVGPRREPGGTVRLPPEFPWRYLL